LAATVPVVITPAGALLNRTGEIKDVTVNAVTAGQPIVVTATVVNTGNRHFKIQGQVVLKDAAGSTVATLPIGLTATSIIPTFAQQVSASYSAMDKPDGLAAGTYKADVQINMEDGAPLGSKETTFQVAAPYALCTGTDPARSLITAFTSQVPGSVHSAGKTDVDLAFTDTGAVTGHAAICQYAQEPAGNPSFEAALDQGGTGATGLKFALIGVEGFNQGTAQVAFHYQTGELGAVDPNSLFLAYRTGVAWRKLDNLAVQTGAQLVAGELPVYLLAQGQIVALGGGAPAPTAAPADVAPTFDWTSYWPLITVAVVLGILLLGGVILVARRPGRGAGEST
jgi:hypothetical protein